MPEEIPKPFGLPDTEGFYQLAPANHLAHDTAQNLLASDRVPHELLDFIALSGYVIRDYPEDVRDEDLDWRYHLLLSLDPQIAAEERLRFAQDPTLEETFRMAHHFPP